MKARRALCGVLALLLLLLATPDRASLADRVLFLRTAEDFLAFASACADDGYSRNLTVYLEADIDIGGLEVPPVPIFLGTFEGKGHRITGVTVEARGSKMGLFRHIAQGAAVRDVHVEGTVAPAGSASQAGILAGINDGEIALCTVRGSVLGVQETGGVAGLNTGVIRGCESHAQVSGETYTGGVAGRNAGTIDACTNYGGVNVRDDMSFTDAGGIAGRSSGDVSRSQNCGEVGAPHNGYNVGGIVGINGGTVARCENSGRVRGRKDVGGIVGQADPIVSIEFAPTASERLGGELEALSQTTQEIADELNAVAGEGMEDIRGLHENVESIRRTAGDAMETGLDEAGDAFGDIAAQLETIGDTAEALLRDTDDFRREAERLLGDMLVEAREAREELDAILEGIEEERGEDARRLRALLAALEEDAQKALELLSLLGESTDELAQLAVAIALIVADDSLSQQEKLEGIYLLLGAFDGGELESAAGELADVAGRIVDGASEAAGVLLGAAEGLASGLGSAWDVIEKHVEAVGESAVELGERLSVFSDALHLHLSAAGGAARRAGDRLDAYLGEAGERAERLLGELEGRLDSVDAYLYSLGDTARRANDSLHALFTALLEQMDALRDVLTDLGKTPELTIDDVSAGLFGGSGGTIERCENSADVQGDINVGGVVGIVGYELNPDPEEDWDIGNLRLTDATATVQAAVIACRSEGDILARNECAGGIVGRADIGSVRDCAHSGRVSVTSGEHCGGIAGFSNGAIADCFALADLEGNDGVGGIAGRGRDISGCYAMVRVQSEGERLGAVAGEAEGDVSQNYFLEEGLSGIDGVNLRGKAWPLSYGAFVVSDVIPAELLALRVDFVAEGDVVHSVPVEYGGTLAREDIPPCPEKEGVYCRWEGVPQGEIFRSALAEAAYLPWTATASSGGERPVLLAEGAFCPDASISLVPIEAADPPSRHRFIEGFAYQIADERGPYGENVRLRVRCPSEEGTYAAAELREDGTVALLLAERDGGYLVFDAPPGGSVIVLQQDSGMAVLLFVGGAAAILLLILAGILLRRRKKASAGRSV